jgi:peptide/nickel transport system ATP-binding protein
LGEYFRRAPEPASHASPAQSSRPAPAVGEGEPVLEVEDLALRFGRAPAPVLDGVSLKVSAGETLCVVGESGCGKSVSALAVMGLLPSPPAHVERGRILLEGRDLLGASPRALADLRGDRMAMIFQEPMTSLNPAFRVGDQLAEAVVRHRNVSRREAMARALEMLTQVRVPAPEQRLREYPHQLSGGLRQRVMIAMALLLDPRLLIADEPTTALDVTVQAQILALIKRMQEASGTAVILITHDLGVVAEVADRVAVMYAGRVVEEGPVESIFDDPQHPYTIGLMGSLPSMAGNREPLISIAGSVPTAAEMPVGCRFATRCPFAIEHCVAESPPLGELAPGHRAACWRAPLEKHVEAAA